MREPLNVEGLCAACGVKRLTVLRWVKRGIPHSRSPNPRGGKKILVFDPDLALAWVAANANMTAGRKRIAEEASQRPANVDTPNGNAGASAPSPDKSTATSAPARGPQFDQTLLSEPGLLGAVERMKLQEYRTSGLLLQLKQKGDAMSVVALQERHALETKMLAQLEAQALAYRMRIGELGSRSEMQSTFERLAVSIKNAVMGIPSNVMPLLIPLLREPDLAHRVREIIDKASRDALRNLVEKRNA